MKVLDWHWFYQLLLLVVIGGVYWLVLWWYEANLSFDRQDTTDFALGLAGVFFAFVIAFIQVGMAMQDRAQGRKRATVALREKFSNDLELYSALKRLRRAITTHLSAPVLAADGEPIGNADDVIVVAKWFEDIQIQHSNGLIDDGLAYDYFYPHLLSVWPALTQFIALSRIELRNSIIFANLEVLYDNWSGR